MALELVTGYQGQDHVTAEQWADFNRGIYGDAAILPVGSEMAVDIQTANQITVKDGLGVFDGREVYIGYGETENIAIASGTQGMLRNDIVVIKYTKQEETGVESVAFEVIEGTPAASNQTDPAYSDQDIRTGVFASQKPFCRVRINGTAIEGIDMLVDVKEIKKHAFNDMANNLATTQEGYALDARQGKALDDKVAQLNSALAFMNAASATDGSSFNKNFLGIGISDPNAETNKRAYFIAAPDQQADFTNVPPGLFNSGATTVGVREVYRRSSTIIMVKITEMLPRPGTQYFRTYNDGNWNESGWRVISPE